MAMSRISAVFDADTSGLTAGTKEATAALRQLSGDISSLDATYRKLEGFTNVFDGFGPGADAASAAMRQLRSDVFNIELAWQSGTLTIGEYRNALASIGEVADRQADLLSRGVTVTRQFATAQEKAVRDASEFAQLYGAGAIDVTTYNRAIESTQAAYAGEQSAANLAKQAEKERLDVMERAKTVITATATAEQQHAAQMRNLNELVSEGAIDERQYAAAVEQSRQKMAENSGATKAAAAAQRALDQAMQQGAAVTRQSATAKEAYRARVAELRGLLLNGAITQQTFSRAVNAAEKEMKQASSAANTYRGSASGLNSVLGKLNTIIALQATQLFVQLTSAITQAVRSIINVGGAIAKSVDSTDLLAKRTGQTVENLAALEFAGRQAGVGIDQLAGATAKADRLFIQAQNGGKQAAAAFKTIGLSVQDLAGLSAEDRFNAIADSIAKLPTQAQQSAAAIAIFGRAGAGLVPLFQDLEGRLGEVRAQAERVGFVLSGDQVKAIDKMNDSLDVAKLSFEGIVRQATAYLAPAIKAAADLWTSFVESTGGANIGQGIVTALLDGAELVARMFDFAASVFRPVWEYASQVVNGFGGAANIWNGVAIVLQSVVLAFKGVLAGIGAVGSAFGAAITKLMSGLLGVAAKVAEYFGKNELAKTLKGMQEYTDKASKASYENMIALGQQSGESFAGAVENIWNPEKYGFAMGNAAGGTFEKSLEDFRARLANQQADAAKRVREAGDGAAAGVAAVVETKLATALDTRTKEGNKELLRLMYGSTQSKVAEETRDATERVADGVDDLNDNIDNLGMEAFAFP